MKRYIIILTTLVVFSSCGWNDPVEDTPLNTLSTLTQISQSNLFSFAYGEPALFSGILMQQIAGVNGTMLDIENYNLFPEYFNTSWGVCYLGVLSNLNSLIIIASDNNYGKYRGIGKIMMANALGIATDVWGDIPYSDSFGIENGSFTPQYDTQESIYNEIFKLLNEGIEDLTLYGNDFHPSSDDIIYNGHSDRWIRYANFLKLRYYWHLSNLYGIETISSFIDKSMFENLGESFSINFLLVNISSPLSFVDNQFPDQIRASESIVQYLTEFNDPRLSVFFRKNSEGNIVGSAPGESNFAASDLSDAIKGPSAKVILGSYTEQMFILAEYYYRKGLEDESRLAFAEAVGSSLVDYDVSDEVWLNWYLNEVVFSLETIITAKSIALFLQVETWVDWRRTGYPLLNTPPVNTTGGIIPRRFSYPLSEYQYNSNNVPLNITITDRVWWDTLSN